MTDPATVPDDACQECHGITYRENWNPCAVHRKARTLPFVLTEAERRCVQALAAAGYPREACGVILEKGGARVLMACRNVQDLMHEMDPASFPRDARTAYYIHPEDLIRIHALRLHEGWHLAVIYHSHVDLPSDFSAADRAGAVAGDGSPAYPGTTYVVQQALTAVREFDPPHTPTPRAYHWSVAAGAFVEILYREAVE